MNLNNHHISLDWFRYKDHLKTKVEGDKVKIYDIIRKKYMILQPEEVVRQLCLLWLIEDQKISRNSIQVEKTIQINGLMRRFDIVVYDKSIKPYILIECKAPNIKITQTTFDQIAAYQWALHAPYLILTNSIENYIARMNTTSKCYEFFNEVPKW